MNNWHEGHGWIKYDPPRGRMKKKTKWWAIVNVDKEITRYYRWWVMKERWIDLCQPSWNAHISIVRGECPPEDLMHLWKKYDGQRIDFKYKHDVYQGSSTTGNNNPEAYWCVEIDCPKLIEIRKEFGFKHDWKLHLTIGRTW